MTTEADRITDVQLSRLRLKAETAAPAYELIRTTRSPRDVTIGQTMDLQDFLGEATPPVVASLCREVQKLRGRVLELETEARDRAFERSEAIDRAADKSEYTR